MESKRSSLFHAPCSVFPVKKVITLFKNEPFSVEMAYEADDHIPAAYTMGLGKYMVHLPKVCTPCARWHCLKQAGHLHGVVTAEGGSLLADENLNGMRVEGSHWLMCALCNL